MDGRESEVVEAFGSWLRSEGWTVAVEVNWADIEARRGGVRLLAEVKGITSSAGLDMDTCYGQLLRRMTDEQDVRYAVVLPESLVRFALRVPEHVRELLAIAIYAVDPNGKVRKL